MGVEVYTGGPYPEWCPRCKEVRKQGARVHCGKCNTALVFPDKIEVGTTLPESYQVVRRSESTFWHLGMTYSEFFDRYKFYPACSKEEWEALDHVGQFSFLAKQAELFLLSSQVDDDFEHTQATVVASYYFTAWDEATASKYFYSKLLLFKDAYRKVFAQNQMLRQELAQLKKESAVTK